MGTRWFGKVLRSQPEGTIIVLDSIRIAKQIEAIRSGYGRKVVHVHLTADFTVLEERYLARAAGSSYTGGLKELSSYAEVQHN